jgi:hypothetical protein
VALYFFERITDSEFIGPIVVAAATEDEAWTVLARRERADVGALRDAGWHVAQELAAIPSRAGIVYPGHYRRAILE